MVACGIISPKTTIRPVETIPAKSPLAILPKKIAIAEFTATLPSNKVRNNKKNCIIHHLIIKYKEFIKVI